MRLLPRRILPYLIRYGLIWLFFIYLFLKKIDLDEHTEDDRAIYIQEEDPEELKWKRAKEDINWNEGFSLFIGKKMGVK